MKKPIQAKRELWAHITTDQIVFALAAAATAAMQQQQQQQTATDRCGSAQCEFTNAIGASVDSKCGKYRMKNSLKKNEHCATKYSQNYFSNTHNAK